MDSYVPASSVPSATWERMLFAIWAIASILLFGLSGWLIARHPGDLAPVLRLSGVGLVYCALFGIAGFVFRRRRLRKLRDRAAFLASLAALDAPDG